jgi:hypothetical protein
MVMRPSFVRADTAENTRNSSCVNPTAPRPSVLELEFLSRSHEKS